MSILLIVLKFWGELILLFAFGWLVGQCIKSDKNLKY